MNRTISSEPTRGELLRLANQLDELGGSLLDCKVFAGFDAAVDCIARPICAQDGDGLRFFETIAEFGEYLVGKRNVSCAIELDVKTTKPGGNAPNLIQALGKLGLRSFSVGMYGEPVEPAFAPIREYAELYSFSGAPAMTALEFNDGKVMLSPGAKLEGNAWDVVAQKVGFGRLLEMLGQSQIIALLNWGEMAFMHEIWEGVLAHAPLGGKTVFMDIADSAKRPDSDIAALVSLIRRFAERTRTILGINENEARLLSEKVLLKPYEPLSACGELNEALGAVVVIHTVSDASVFTGTEHVCAGTLYCPAPKLFTGAGDNFNAGFCLGVALGLPERECLILGNALSSFYVSNGKNAFMEELRAYLTAWGNQRAG